jgi:membrane protein required for beta-lactamase induction
MMQLPFKLDQSPARYRPRRQTQWQWLISLDQFGGAGQQHRHRHAKRPGGRQVDDQFELSRLLDWQIARLLALEYSSAINAEFALERWNVGSIAHQAAGLYVFTHRVARRHETNTLIEPKQALLIGH